MNTPLKRTIEIGTMKDNPDQHVFIDIDFDGKRLSITGDIANKNKTQTYACGQISMSLKPEDINPADDWDTLKIARLLNIWNRWHLNGMRAGCEHQERNWNKNKELQIPKYTWTHEYHNARNRAANGKMDMREYKTFRTISQKVIDLTINDNRNEEIIKLLTDAKMIRIEKIETKIANWVTPSEHQDGILTKPCEICGYQYGTKWNFEPVPGDVLEYLRTV